MAKKKPDLVAKPIPAQGMDLNQVFNKFIANTATIAQHCQAIKLVGKGIDIDGIEKVNNENQQLVIALGNFINQAQKVKLPGKSANRAERRRAARAAKKTAKKR